MMGVRACAGIHWVSTPLPNSVFTLTHQNGLGVVRSLRARFGEKFSPSCRNDGDFPVGCLCCKNTHIDTDASIGEYGRTGNQPQP